MYIVNLIQERQGRLHYTPHFVTENGNLAAEYCVRFNRLMDEQYNRTIETNKGEFLARFLILGRRRANYREIEVR